MHIKRVFLEFELWLSSILLTGFLLLSSTSNSQTLLGTINSKHYTKYDYNAGTQNWAACQDKKGRMYFANNEGVLVYDGVSWKIIPLPNKTIVRFITFDKHGRLYAGGQDELGYFEPGERGLMNYTSLLPLLNKHDQDFADIWNIAVLDDDVFFRSNSKIFHFHEDKLTHYASAAGWDFVGVDGNRIIAQDKAKGLLVFRNGGWSTLISKENLPENFKITSITPFLAGSLVTTIQSGLFLFTQSTLQPFLLKGNGINNTQYFTSSIEISNDNILIGTYDNGIIQADKSGNINGGYAKGNNLLSNDVKFVFTDKHKNIWAALDNGISFIGWNEAVRKISPNVFNGAAGYSSVLFSNQLYFAMANGLYHLPIHTTDDISQYDVAPTKMADGLSWHLDTLKNHLFLGTDKGLYEVVNNSITQLDGSSGYWMVKPMAHNAAPYSIVGGNYQGISFFAETNNGFQKTSSPIHVNASSRFVVYDSTLNVVWVSHPYRGIYKINIKDKSVKVYTAENGLPSNLDNHVFSIARQTVVATTAGIYIYNISTNRFEPSPLYEKIFGKISIRYINNDAEGNLWFVHEKQLGMVRKDKNEIIYISELTGKILSGFENIFPLNKKNIIVGSADGFYHINFEKYTANAYRPEVFISKVLAKGIKDSLLFNGFEIVNDSNQLAESKISYKWTSFHFEYASAAFETADNMEYSFMLEGFDDDWSSWAKTTFKDYTNIPPGNYSFMVKSRNNLGAESTAAIYAITISPAWYDSLLAWIVYVCSFFFGVYYFWKWREATLKRKQDMKIIAQRKKYEEEQKQIGTMHQLELEQSEKEMIRIRNEKLEAEIEFKNAELASTAMNLVQKKEFLVKFKDELNKLKQPQASGLGSVETADINKLLRSLAEQLNEGDEWEQFSLLFNKLHRDYLLTLKKKYPSITAHELKLCAYLRMNLSSKEIAHLMSISVRGVEIGRYRLRKKLEIPAKEDLFQFLLQIEMNKPDEIK